ncbi:MAG: radical SAM protein [Clostridia bacterium]|nr:radical SAM protein [Clostridia bacterium]
MICNLCPRQCRSLRTENENLNGYCKMPLLPRVARADLHFWEEPCISGKNGSGTVFFSGCSLSCVYCQNYDVSHNELGNIMSYERLAEIFKELEQKGAHNINLVTPSHYILAIKKALDIYRPSIPIVYNSSGYDLPSALKLLEGYIDIFLLDFKYISEDRADKYSNASNYPIFAKQAIAEALRQQPCCIIENGIMQKGVIIRHLLLPQGTREAMAVFDYVRENAKNAFFSIMSQYVPFGEALEMPIINRKVTKREYQKVIDYISSFDFRNVYTQEHRSADTKYIPSF